MLSVGEINNIRGSFVWLWIVVPVLAIGIANVQLQFLKKKNDKMV